MSSVEERAESPLTPPMVGALRRLARQPAAPATSLPSSFEALRRRGLAEVSGSGFWQLTARGRVVVEDEIAGQVG